MPAEARIVSAEWHSTKALHLGDCQGSCCEALGQEQSKRREDGCERRAHCVHEWPQPGAGQCREQSVVKREHSGEQQLLSEVQLYTAHLQEGLTRGGQVG